MEGSLVPDARYSTTRRVTKQMPGAAGAVAGRMETHLFLPEGEGRRGEGGMRTGGLFKRTDPQHPLLSVVTVVYNGEKHLEQTIRSVLDQSYDNVEYIIIDGGSTDGTVGIIRRYEQAIDYWVSEKDGGIYDAMNKGLSCAAGDYIAFINADDWYEPGAFERIAAAAVQSGADFLTANIRIIGDGGGSVIRKSGFGEWGKNIHHQTCFIRRELHRRFPFDTRFRYAADRDLFVRLLKQGVSTRFVDTVVADFREGGAGSGLLAYQCELFRSNRTHIGLFFALKRYVLNVVGRTLLNRFRIKR